MFNAATHSDRSGKTDVISTITGIGGAFTVSVMGGIGTTGRQKVKSETEQVLWFKRPLDAQLPAAAARPPAAPAKVHDPRSPEWRWRSSE